MAYQHISSFHNRGYADVSFSQELEAMEWRRKNKLTVRELSYLHVVRTSN